MKTIQPVSIWTNGKVQQGKVLNTYATQVVLSTSASFYYSISEELDNGTLGDTIAQGNLNMTGEAYEQWEVDSYAWDWVAAQLNLTITGDYIPPVPVTTSSTTTQAPVTTTSTTTTSKK
jgi:hypothetical protein